MSEVSLLDCPEEEVFLAGEEAVKLWLKGKDAWNQWVEENPDADVSFADVDFKSYRKENKRRRVSFVDYKFPKGRVDFTDAIFGDGWVDFKRTHFNDGDVDFSGSSFGNGNVTFSSATFGKGYRDFSGIDFDKGSLNFKRAKFSDGAISFFYSSMSKGNFFFNEVECGIDSIDFTGFVFGDGIVNFSKTNFGDGDLVFNEASFSNGTVSFSQALFGKGFVDFRSASFGKGIKNFSLACFNTDNVVFDNTDFGTGNVIFTKAKLLGRNFSFAKITFSGFAIFDELVSSEDTKCISFKHSTFERSLDLSSKGLHCIPDLTSTKTSNQIILSNLNFNFKREGRWYNKKATSKEDIASLRRLKEIAENNKDHAAALRFHADEMRAKRWHEMGTGASLLDMCFSGLSNYGQSIVRPFVTLCTLMFVMALYVVGFAFPLSLTPKDYSQWLSNTLSIDFSTWLNGFELAVSSALPFISSSRNVHKQAEEVLQGILPDYFGALSLVYGGLCFLFLFLIGLGLRNRFRI